MQQVRGRGDRLLGVERVGLRGGDGQSGGEQGEGERDGACDSNAPLRGTLRGAGHDSGRARRPRRRVLLVLGVPATAAASGVQGPASGREVVLVANAEGGTVSVVDARTFAVLREIDVLPDGADDAGDDPAQARPAAVIEAAGGKNYAQDHDLSPDGRTLYVSRGHRGDVAAFDLATGEQLWKMAIPGFRSDHMTLATTARRLWVSALTENVVVRIDTRAHAIAGRFAGGAVAARQPPVARTASASTTRASGRSSRRPRRAAR